MQIWLLVVLRSSFVLNVGLFGLSSSFAGLTRVVLLSFHFICAEFVINVVDLLFIFVFQKCAFCVCHTSLSLLSVLLICYLYLCFGYALFVCHTSLSLLSVPLILYFCCTESQLVISVYGLVSCALLLENAEGYIENVQGYFFELTCYS